MTIATLLSTHEATGESYAIFYWHIFLRFAPPSERLVAFKTGTLKRSASKDEVAALPSLLAIRVAINARPWAGQRIQLLQQPKHSILRREALAKSGMTLPLPPPPPERRTFDERPRIIFSPTATYLGNVSREDYSWGGKITGIIKPPHPRPGLLPSFCHPPLKESLVVSTNMCPVCPRRARRKGRDSGPATKGGWTNDGPEVSDGLRLEGISFTPPGSKMPALSGIDLHAPAGSVVTVVGEAGAGKVIFIFIFSAAGGGGGRQGTKKMCTFFKYRKVSVFEIFRL